MNELNKLIEQYERENQGKKVIRRSRNISSPSYYTNEFVLWLASRPTCGVEQRKFLDEVENGKGEISWDQEEGILYLDEPIKADIEKVIKGK